MKSNRFLNAVFWSTVGKKLVISLTGLGLLLFIIFHLLGNLIIVFGSSEQFNSYSHKLISLGPLLYILEFILAAGFLFHFTLAVITALKNRKARSANYVMVKSAGRESKKTVSSTTMIYTGIVIIVFTALHIITFKYGPGISEGYVTTINGENMRDLYRLVIEVFQKEWYVIWYVVAMIFLGIHLRHGFWSAFQSLGINNQSSNRILYRTGLLVAVLLGGGFLLIPVYVYLVF